MEDDDQEELEDLKTEVGRLNREIAEIKSEPPVVGVCSCGMHKRSRPRPKPSKAWAVLGLLTVMGLGFLLIFIGIPPFIAGIAAVFIGGFLARRAGAGALVGFFGVFLPLFLIGLMLGWGLITGVGGLAAVFVGAIGMLFMIAGAIFGLIGAGIGIIAGLISSKVWKYKPLLKQMMSRV